MKIYCAILIIVVALGNANAQGIRTDGIYVYDNGLDTVRYSSIIDYEEAKRLLDSLDIIKREDSTCLPHHVILDIDRGTTYVHFIRFYDKNKGRADGTVCREKVFMKRSVERFYAQYDSTDTYLKIAQINDIGIFDSNIVFYKGRDRYSMEKYTGVIAANGDLVLKVVKVMAPNAASYDVNYKRNYRFYTFDELRLVLDDYTDSEKIFFRISK